MKKSTLRLALLMAVLMLVSIGMTACNGGGSTTTTPPATTPPATDSATPPPTDAATPPPETTPPANEEIKLSMTFWGSPDEKTAVEQAVQNFKNVMPNVTVEATQIPEGEYDAQIAALVASNDPPNYGYIHGPQGEQFAKEGRFINWFEQLKNDPDLKVEDFVDGIFYQLDKDNAWGVCSAIECFGLYYDKKAFDDAGVAYPPATYDGAWTWEQFLDAAKKLTKDANGKTPNDSGFDANNIQRYGVAFETWWGPVQTMVLNNGADVVMPDGKTFGYGTPAGYNAIQSLADLINVHKVAPSTLAQGLPSHVDGLQAGVYGMTISGQWIDLDLGNAGYDFGIGALPKMPDSKTSGTIKLSGASAMFKSDDQAIFDASWAFSKFMCGDGVKSLYQGGLWMPTLKKYYTDPALLAEWMGPNAAHPESFKDSMLDMVLNHSKPAWTLTTKNQAELDTAIGEALGDVWLGKVTAKDAMTALNDSIQSKIQGRYDQ